jgi:hypothetical protein
MAAIARTDRERAEDCSARACHETAIRSRFDDRGIVSYKKHAIDVQTIAFQCG